MKHTLLTLAGLLLAPAAVLIAADGPPPAQRMAVLPPHPWGVYTWGSDRAELPKEMPVKGIPLTLRWSQLEPQSGKFDFDQQVRVPLEQARARGYYVHLMVWVAPDKHTPPWLFDLGVPRVEVPERIDPTRKLVQPGFPYYFSPIYKERFHGMIQALGDYVAGLPADLKSRLVFVQVAEGSTGDGQPYKGTPTDARYEISKPEWSEFRRETWAVYQKAFQRADGSVNLALLVNGDANNAAENAWLLDHNNVFGTKQGMFSHGYLVSDTVERLAEMEKFRAEARARGKVVFTRGEQDGEWQVCGWSKQNPPQAFYWAALFALQCKLDIWNVPVDALRTQPIGEAVRIFNRYAGYNEAAESPVAFCALRRGLDAADTKTFPEAKFGAATRKNLARYLAIAKAFAPFGARQGDPQKALGGGMVNRQADDQNNVGWGILPGNFERWLTQINPEDTSLGVWNLESAKQPYGLFARRFDAASDRTEMRFRLADGFFKNPAEPHSMRIGVVYLDRGRGSWSLIYANPDGEKAACTVTLANSGKWRDVVLTLPDAVWNHRLSSGGDLALRHVSGDDTTFHLIELEKQ